MRILHQSPSLSAVFQSRVEDKINTQRQEINSGLDNGLLSMFAGFGFELDRVKKQIKGNIGEWGVSLLMNSFIFPIAKWLGIKDCSAPVLENINALISMIINSPACLNSNQVLSISEAIEDYKVGDLDKGL